MLRATLSSRARYVRFARLLNSGSGGFVGPAAEGGAGPAADDARRLERLAKYYPPHLLRSILAAETAVTPEMRQNLGPPSAEFMQPYDDDFAQFDPLYDHAQGEWVDKNRPRQPIPQRAPRDLREQEDVMSSRSPLAINLSNLERSTGLRKEFLADLTVRTLFTKRVVNMEAAGKKRRIYALVIVGDGNGHIGIGQGKSREHASAIKNAHWEAAKNIKYIPRFKERTIYGSVSLKKGSVYINLNAARPGSGLRVNHIVYEVCKLAGIRDLVGNVFGSRNPMNVAKAAIQALSEKQAVIGDIASSRGKRIVDVTSTYQNF